MPGLRLVLASNNAKKLQELQTLLGALSLELVAQGSLGVTEAEEPHATFVENALTKARHAAAVVGGAAIADDSGLERGRGRRPAPCRQQRPANSGTGNPAP
jgi:XTP/dITP diphosphohydrolase